MSLWLAVELNDDIKKKLAKEQVLLKQNCKKGDFEDPTRFHITVKYLSDEIINHECVIKAMQKYKDDFKPCRFKITARDFYKFEQGVMWVGVHQSLPLYIMKKNIEKCLNEVGYNLPKDKHKQYTPHITMGYNVQELNSLNNKFNGIEIDVDNLSLWNSFKANDVYIHNKMYSINF